MRDLNTLEAYELLEKKELQDLNSVGYRLRHKKTGAKIALIRNDDENKVFYIGFRTPKGQYRSGTHRRTYRIMRIG